MFEAHQSLYRSKSRLFEYRTLKQRCTGELVIFLCFNVVCWARDVHQATDSEHHEQKRQLMGHERIVHLRGNIGVVEWIERRFVELRGRYWIVPKRYM